MLNYIFCFPFCLAANWTDWRSGKIRNYLVIALAVSGLILQMVLHGFTGILYWFEGLMPAFVLLPFFALKMIGAGDIKFLSAAGGMVGIRPAACLLIYSLIASGCLGVVVLMVRGNFKSRFRILGRYLKSCFLLQSVIPYTGETDNDTSGRFEFSYGITIALVITGMYFVR
jgi:prepilin peptidase CpaA